jgi:hypothetical protein
LGKLHDFKEIFVWEEEDFYRPLLKKGEYAENPTQHK